MSHQNGIMNLKTNMDLIEVTSNLLRDKGIHEKFELFRIEVSGNNRVYKIVIGEKKLLLKHYYSGTDDMRDRIGTEITFIAYALNIGTKHVPKIISFNRDNNIAIYEYIDGRRLYDSEINAEHISTALEFLRELNVERNSHEASWLSEASEACFSLKSHYELVNRRIDRLANIQPILQTDIDAVKLYQTRITPLWRKVSEQFVSNIDLSQCEYERNLIQNQRCISPSDFGFHNAILKPDGDIVFIDFEYSGWDDPAKMVCDFFNQIAVPINLAYFESFCTYTADFLSLDSRDFLSRCRMLIPIYRMKWICIVLNDFLISDAGRRCFSVIEEEESRKKKQLDKAISMIDSAESKYNDSYGVRI